MHVESITPSYYPAETSRPTYELRGGGFLGVPRSALAVEAIDNERPLQYRYDNRPIVLFDLEIISDSLMRVTARINAARSTNYLGCILTKDRSIVIWENNTKPLT